jgi:D-aminopeptidase
MLRLTILASCLLLTSVCSAVETPTRPRARQAGVQVGVIPPGLLNAITDVAGVLVGHTTVTRGDNIRTGVTAILPHPGNLFREKVPGAVFVGNAFGKLAGSTQVNELGEIETPILLTSTLSVPRVADAVIDYMLTLAGNESVQSINPLVGETNDGYLNDIRSRPISREDVFAAIHGAKTGAVEEGSVGAGTGTIAFGWKGGIGTASRKLPPPSAAIRLAFWFRPTLAACFPSTALPSEKNSVAMSFATS